MSSSHGQQLLRLEELYETHHRVVVGLAFNLLHDREDAEDVAQDVFLAAWRSGASYTPARGSVRTWLLSMVRHRCIDHLRARARRAHTRSAELIVHQDAHGSASEAIESADSAAVLVFLHDRLPDEQRQAVELAYFHGLSQTEIANLLDLPLGTVKGRIRNALVRLRPVFSGVDSAIA